MGFFGCVACTLYNSFVSSYITNLKPTPEQIFEPRDSIGKGSSLVSARITDLKTSSKRELRPGRDSGNISITTYNQRGGVNIGKLGELHIHDDDPKPRKIDVQNLATGLRPYKDSVSFIIDFVQDQETNLFISEFESALESAGCKHRRDLIYFSGDYSGVWVFAKSVDQLSAQAAHIVTQEFKRHGVLVRLMEAFADDEISSTYLIGVQQPVFPRNTVRMLIGVRPLKD